ncbi:MAG TPA: hypothetical protein VGL70_06050 [Candidatus Binatia bacterium]
MSNIKRFVLLVILVSSGSACKFQFPYVGRVFDFRPSVQKTAGPILPLHCDSAACPECNPISCPEPAIRPVAYALEAKPALKTVATPSPGKTPPARSPGGPRLSALIARDELEKLSVKAVVFNAPEQMNAGVHEKVEVRIAENLPEDFLVKLKELGIMGADEIAARSSVTARLVGDGFEIQPLGDDEKAVSEEGLTPWMWDVTPVRSGTQPLLLLMTINVKIPGGGNETKELPVFSKPAQVAGSPAYATVRFLRGRWPWFAGGFFTLGVAVWFLRRRRA